MSNRDWHIVLDHYHKPRNRGTMDKPDSVAEGVNELCGDRLRFQVALTNDVVSKVMFLGDGCAVSLATASILTEKAEGLRVSEIGAFSVDELVADLKADIKPGRLQCVSLPIDVLQEAVKQLLPGGLAG